MKVLNPLSHRIMTEMQPGELVIQNFGGGPTLAIVLRGADRQRSYAVLRGPKIVVPTIYHGGGEGEMLSYGSEVVLEVTPSEETGYTLVQPEPTPGMAIMAGGRLLLAFHEERSGSSETNFYDSAEWILEPYPPRQARGFSWRIWANEADRDRLGALPIYEWKPPADPQLAIF